MRGEEGSRRGEEKREEGRGKEEGRRGRGVPGHCHQHGYRGFINQITRRLDNTTLKFDAWRELITLMKYIKRSVYKAVQD